MVKPMYLFLAIAVLLLIGAGIWIAVPVAETSTESPPLTSSEFFKTNRQYDTSGGQEMKPRWND